MTLSDDEKRLLCAALFALSVSRCDNEALRRRIHALARKLGGDPGRLFFGPGPGPTGR